MNSTHLLIKASARKIPISDGSIHCVVTSPPYWGLRDYAVPGQIGLERRPSDYVAAMVEVFREVRRVLRHDGTLWLNVGDSYSAERWSDKPSTTGISRKCQDIVVPRESGLPPKNLVGIPWKLAFALQEDGWFLRSEIIWHKPNPMPESVRDRPTKSHEQIFLLSKRERYYYDPEAIREAKSGEEGRNARSVWSICTRTFSGAHFAVFPTELPDRCIRAGCPPGGIVLDPFNGSGTTGAVAVGLGRSYIGLDINSTYLAMAEKRITRPHLRLRGKSASDSSSPARSLFAFEEGGAA